MNKTFIFICLEKPNGFKYEFVTINYYFIIINATLVQIITSKRKCKRKTTVKNTPTNNCNTMRGTTKKVVQLNYCCKWRHVK